MSPPEQQALPDIQAALQASADTPAVRLVPGDTPAVPLVPGDALAVPLVPGDTPAVPLVPGDTLAVPLVPGDMPLAQPVSPGPGEKPSVPRQAALGSQLGPLALRVPPGPYPEGRLRLVRGRS